MNAIERRLFGRVYVCVQRLGSLGPRNPMDIKTLALADRTIQQAAPQIANAISNIGFRDYEEAELDLADAERTLKIQPDDKAPDA